MNYELALELQDAGFPQAKKLGGYWIPAPHHVEDEKTEYTKGIHGERVPKWMFEKSVWCPSLSELIEACGEGFRQLTWDKKEATTSEWVASKEVYYDDAGYQDLIGEGKTPEEAVARLWLALNKK